MADIQHNESDFLTAFRQLHVDVFRWLARPCTRASFESAEFGAGNAEYGENLNLRLQRVRAANGELGIYLSRLCIPPAWRRRGHATLLLDNVLRAAREARYAWLMVTWVTSHLMEALMRRRAEFVPVADRSGPPESYIARLE